MASNKKLTPREKFPELFREDAGIDPRTRTRTVPMEVLNMSFPRTGTISMHTAFNILNIPSFHSVSLLCNKRDVPLWASALKAKYFDTGTPFTRDDWDCVLGSYGAVSADCPAVCLAEELIAAYPEAKIILIEREIEAWYASFSTTVVAAMWSRPLRLMAALDPWWMGPNMGMHQLWLRGWWKARSRQEMCDMSRDMYRRHYEMIRRVAPKERLLEYRLGDGWEPLCAFLGKPVPDVPFPHVNDAEALNEMNGIAFRKGFKNFITGVAPVVLSVVVVGIAWVFRRPITNMWSEF